MEQLKILVQALGNGNLGLGWAMFIVASLIIIVGLVSVIVSIFLSIAYIKYNHTKNSAGLTGVETARQILDANDLQHIKVKTMGSLIFGNSYSHYFKKVRLRRLTRNKTSLTALAMGAEKASLAVLDKEGDPDMRTRIKLVPLITFGPLAFIPLLLVGVILDFLLFSFQGWTTLLFAGIGFAFYLFALILSVVTLKTEKKAQERACSILKEQNLASEEEIVKLQKLFKLYNIEYINDIILSFLELVYYVLRFASYFVGNGNSTGRK